MGTRTYLATTLFEELTPGHCLIVPIQHHLSMLEADDDVWDEVKVSWLVATLQPSRFSDYGCGAELYEMPHEDALRGGEGSHLLRDCDKPKVAEAYRYRMRTSTDGSLRRHASLFQGKIKHTAHNMLGLLMLLWLGIYPGLGS